MRFLVTHFQSVLKFRVKGTEKVMETAMVMGTEKVMETAMVMGTEKVMETAMGTKKAMAKATELESRRIEKNCPLRRTLKYWAVTWVT
jgi:hypothetical protein